jgi:hypothetical protein
MKKILAAQIEKKFPGTGRAVGAKLAEVVEPGDIIDFEGFISTTNSFADEFVKIFIHKYGQEAFHSLKFENTSEMMEALLNRAFIRRTRRKPHVRVVPSRRRLPEIRLFPA